MQIEYASSAHAHRTIGRHEVTRVALFTNLNSNRTKHKGSDTNS